MISDKTQAMNQKRAIYLSSLGFKLQVTSVSYVIHFNGDIVDEISETLSKKRRAKGVIEEGMRKYLSAALVQMERYLRWMETIGRRLHRAYRRAMADSAFDIDRMDLDWDFMQEDRDKREYKAWISAAHASRNQNA